jgi:hypothetical protein
MVHGMVYFCCVDLPVSSPAGALPLAAEGVDELDMAATASSLLPASLDTVIVLVAEFFKDVGRSGDFVRWNRGRESCVSSERSPWLCSEQVQERERVGSGSRQEGRQRQRRAGRRAVGSGSSIGERETGRGSTARSTVAWMLFPCNCWIVGSMRSRQD